MVRYDGLIWLEVLDDSGKCAVAGQIYGDVVDLPEFKPELCVRGQPDENLASFFKEQRKAKSYPLKARISAPYPHDWWITEIELREISIDNPAHVLLTSANTPRRAVLSII